MHSQEGSGRSFRKMRLLPFHGDEESGALKAIRNYDPAVNSMAHSLVHARKARSKRRNLVAAAGLRNAYMQRFKAHSMQRKNSRAPAHDDQPRVDRPVGVSEVPMPRQADGDAWYHARAVPPDARDIRAGDEVQVPLQYQRKAHELLLALARAPPGSVGQSDHGELVIDGEVMRGTSFTGAVRGLYVSSTLPPPGTRQLVRKLHELRVPPNLLCSRFARNVYNQGGGSFRFVRRHVPPITRKRAHVLRVYR